MLIGSKIIQLKETFSTNQIAWEMIKSNEALHGMVIQADYQLNGIGHSGSAWESERGENLLMSIILKPDFLKAEQNFMLSKIVSLALLNVVKHANSNTKIKWPNDIFCNDKKICGILIKNSLMGEFLSSSVIGIGLNVNQQVFNRDANATSINMETGKKESVSNVRNQVVSGLNHYYEVLKSGDYGFIDDEYLACLYKINKEANFKDKEGLFKGTIEGVNEHGNLLVSKSGKGLCMYGFKEIEYIS